MFEAVIEPDGFTVFSSSGKAAPNIQIFLSNGEAVIEAIDDIDCQERLRGYVSSGHNTPGEALQAIAAKLEQESLFREQAAFLKKNRVISGIRF